MTERLMPEMVSLTLGEILALAADDAFLPKTAAAALLGLKARSFEQEVAPQVPQYRRNGRSYFRRADLLAFMERFRVDPEPKKTGLRGALEAARKTALREEGA